MSKWRRFAGIIVVAAGLVLVGESTTAAAGVVRCVSSADPTCQVGYTTIGAAVTAASPGDVILVGRGTYNETVMVDKTVFLFGAQAGVDARTRPGDPIDESTVNATATGGLNAGFIVTAPMVVIDGFTVQGATDGTANGGGIDLKGGAQPADGATILNNILQNNAVGLYLNFEGFAPVSNVLIEHNLFRNNNAGPQASSGNGIFTSACENVVITENTFTGHQRLGIGINNSTSVTITHNESQQNARFVVFTGTMSSQFSHNHGQNFVASSLFSASRATAVAIGFNNGDLTITGNVLEGGQAGSTIRGIQFGGYPGPNPANTNLTVSYNTIRNMPLSGIVAETAMLANSLIVGNVIAQNAADGIFIGTGNSGNVVIQNAAASNAGFDCHDSSTGGGTLGTANVWSENDGTTSSPVGLCVAQEVTLTVTKAGAGGGTVTSAPAGINCGVACTAAYRRGGTVILAAVPAAGSFFAGWSGGGCSDTAACQLMLNANTTVTATFVPGVALTISRTGVGSVTSSPAGIACGGLCSFSFPPGSSVTLTPTPAPGSVFMGWSGGGCSGTSPCTLALGANTGVTATFTLDTPPSVGLVPSGTVFHVGDFVSFTVTFANPGPAGVGDFYFGVLLPASAGPGLGCAGRDAVVFFAPGFTPVTSCLSSPVSTFAPLMQNVSVPAGVGPVVVPNFFGFTWPPGTPPGIYTFFDAFTALGVFNGPTASLADVAGAGTAAVTVLP